jgi:DNA-binding MarR family transcriptional regulator
MTAVTDSATPYLTYKLDLLKSLATRAADEAYGAEVDLRVRELRVLRLMHDHPGITATELRHLLVLDKTLMSKNLAVLEQRGLLRREVDESDNRVQKLFLTADGKRAWRNAERLGRRLEDEMFGQMTRAQWNELHRLLDVALASFHNWREGQPGGQGPSAVAESD